METVGIIGAGKVGIVLAQLAAKAGYKVFISGSGSSEKIALTVSVLVPGAVALTSKEVTRQSDITILAIPLGRYEELPKEALKGKLVIDAMNYWWEVDGERPEFTNPAEPTSAIVQHFLHDSQVVKAFSHIGYHDLYDEASARGSPERKAVAIAGDTSKDVDEVARLVNTLGFDPIIIGKLSDSAVLQPGGPIFGAHVSAVELRKILPTASFH